MKADYFRKAPKIVVALILAGAVFLAACSGDAAAQVQAVVEAQTQGGAVEAVEEAAVEGAAVEAEVLTESDDMSEADQAGEEVSEEASVEEEARTVPVLVHGSPVLKSTDPSTFEIASGRIQLVEFFAFWCPTCKRMATTVHGLEDIYGEDINFVFLDQDDPATAPFREAFGYRYQPEFYLLNPDGIILGTWIGYTDGAILQDALERALENASS